MPFNPSPIPARASPPRSSLAPFLPFQRLASQSPASADGVGLGLTVVKAIADAHDAIIIAHARPDGGLKIDVTFAADTGVVVPGPAT